MNALDHLTETTTLQALQSVLPLDVPPAPPARPRTGADERDEYLRRLEEYRKAWVHRARQWAVDYAREHGTVTADDIRAHIGIPEGFDGRVMGAVFNTPLLRPVGWTTTSVRTSHARPIRVFAPREEAETA